MKKILLVLILVIVLVIIGVGVWFVYNNQPTKKQDVGLANPASVFCVNNGGRSEIRTNADGSQAGFCIFKNNSECDEWAYFRGECKMGVQRSSPIACTQEAKQCPDGSFVSRTGPHCEFSQCPNTSTSNKSGVNGTVTLSPTCPVERIPPDPKCAPKPYSTSIDITKTGSTKIIKTIQSNGNGLFSVNLDPGVYVLQAHGGQTLPRCGSVYVEVKNRQYATTNISCDTGIR